MSPRRSSSFPQLILMNSGEDELSVRLDHDPPGAALGTRRKLYLFQKKNKAGRKGTKQGGSSSTSFCEKVVTVAKHTPWFTLLSSAVTIAGVVIFSIFAAKGAREAEKAVQQIGGNVLYLEAILRTFVTVTSGLVAAIMPVGLIVGVSATYSRHRRHRADKSSHTRLRHVLFRTLSVVSLLAAFVLVLVCVAALCMLGVGTAAAKIGVEATLIGVKGMPSVRALTNQMDQTVTRFARRVSGAAALSAGAAAAAPPSAAELACPSNACLDASRFAFLRSRQCICDEDLLALFESFERVFDSGVVATVGATLLVAGTLGLAMCLAANYANLKWEHVLWSHAVTLVATNNKTEKAPLTTTTGGGGGGGGEANDDDCCVTTIAIFPPPVAGGEDEAADDEVHVFDEEESDDETKKKQQEREGGIMMEEDGAAASKRYEWRLN